MVWWGCSDLWVEEDWRQAAGRLRAAYMPPLRSDGNGQAEGSRPLPTMWKVRGWLWEVRGPGMPGPYGGEWREWYVFNIRHM